MPFMPAVSLNQRSGVLPAACGSSRDFFDWLFLSAFASSAVQLFGFHVCCPNASFLWCSVLSFYPLEQAPNIMIYAMSKSGTATSGLI